MRRNPFRMYITTFAAFALAGLCGLASIGCEQKSVEPEPVVHTPLDLDPTQDIVLGQWWTNGKELLRLYDDGRYSQYASMNRYEIPEQRGRWSRGSYAVIWMEPYATRQQRIRVSIDRADGKIVLNIPKLGVLHSMDDPPPVLEDRLIGTWENQIGAIRLNSNMRFEYSRKWAGDNPSPTTMPAQGKWRITGQILELIPDSPAYETVWIEIKVSTEGITLQSPKGIFRKQTVGMITSETHSGSG